MIKFWVQFKIKPAIIEVRLFQVIIFMKKLKQVKTFQTFKKYNS